MNYFLETKIETSFVGQTWFVALPNQKEERMTNLKLIGAAAVLSSMLAGPALAQHHITNSRGISLYCATKDPGNPYNEQEDYMSWSAWRGKGGWDSRGDDACLRNPSFSPPGGGFY
jgi:hypothetical protein